MLLPTCPTGHSWLRSSVARRSTRVQPYWCASSRADSRSGCGGVVAAEDRGEVAEVVSDRSVDGAWCADNLLGPTGEPCVEYPGGDRIVDTGGGLGPEGEAYKLAQIVWDEEAFDCLGR